MRKAKKSLPHTNPNMNRYLAILAFFGLFAACKSDNNTRLPILGAREAVSKVVAGETVVDTIYKTLPDFEFVNQDSTIITGETFRNSIYVADFFFTSCPSICPIMHRNMLRAYEKFKDNPEVMFLSHSIDTKYDTPAVLKDYAVKLGADGPQWQFVTGSRESIYGIAPEYMVFAEENDKVAGGYEHQGWFILVDKDKHIRGAYDGTDADQVEKMMKDMDILLQEYEK
jgi:protein SCO1/2